MVTFERTYKIPLRKGTQRAARTRRAKKAVRVLRDFVGRHAKSNNIVIGEALNEYIWENGMRNPPDFVNVTVLKEKDGKVFVNLVGSPVKPVASKAD